MASELQSLRLETAISPINLTSQDYRSGWIDMSDCDESLWLFMFGTVTNDPTQVGVIGSNDGGSTFGTVSTGSVIAAFGAFGGSAASLPTGTTADNQRVGIYVNNNDKLMRAIVGAGASNNLVSCLVIKGRMKESPATATDRGLLAQIVGA